MLREFTKKYKDFIFQISPYFADKASDISFINHSWVRNYNYDKVFLQDIKNDDILIEIPNCYYGDNVGSIANLCNYKYFEKNYPELVITCGNDADGNTLYFSLLKFIKMDRKENWSFAYDFEQVMKGHIFDDDYYKIEMELIEENLDSWLARDIESSVEAILEINFLTEYNQAGKRLFYEYLWQIDNFNLYWEYISIAWYASNFQEHLEGITKEVLNNLKLRYEEN